MIRTQRLLLREWKPRDLESFIQMNQDPNVMEYFPKLYSREETLEQYKRILIHFFDYGYGLYAVEIPGIEKFAGYVGLSHPKFTAHFTPCVEIGWRLATPYWGKGYATEGGLAVLDYGFQVLGLDEVVSFTAEKNRRSERVMQKLGMNHDPGENFLHPSLPEGHPLSLHILYRKKKPG